MEAKWLRLCGAVAEKDQYAIANMDLENAKAYLIKRYRSPDAIRQFAQAEFAKIKFDNSRDLDGAKALGEVIG